MSDIEKKRQYLMGLYPGPAWKQRVQNMPEHQVIAIYLRKQGEPKKVDKPKESTDAPTLF